MSNTSVETVNQSGDKLKISLAILIIIAGVFAYSYFDNMNIYARVGIFVGSLVVAAILAFFSHLGKRFMGFAMGAYNEVRRVVWPTRKETIQMTGIVFAFVIVMAFFLWIVDKVVEWLLYSGFLGWY